MDFSSISNSKKIELLKLKLSSVEELLFQAIITAGFMPDEFDPVSFEKEFLSLDKEEISIGSYSTYADLNKNLQLFLKLKDAIQVLGKE